LFRTLLCSADALCIDLDLRRMTAECLSLDNWHMLSLLQALHEPRCYPHAVGTVRLIETHISWVLLTGAYAYKLKKPVALGFVDFSTLELRRHYCAEELRLNRRLAPQLYIEVVPITGSVEDPVVGGRGTPIEYALKMREFEQDDLLAHRLSQGLLLAQHIDAIADTCVSFHARTASADPSAQFGTADALLAAALDNFQDIHRQLSGNGMRLRLAALRRWTQEEHARQRAHFAKRKDAERIRECHGDLHLGNIALVDGQPVIFDCIEFNADFRWIDVMNEMAFVAMDLAARTRPDFAFRLLNRYLEGSGDYEGLRVLRFYLVYRALVRAKIDCIRARQPDLPQGADTQEWQDFVARVQLAENFAQPGRRLLAITFGLSGSGKTLASQHALEQVQAIRVRSDVERKRLFELQPSESSDSSIDSGIYSAQASHRTYTRLAETATICIKAGFPVIVDAAFLRRETRQRFRALAAALAARFVIISCSASARELQARIERRHRANEDASEANLEVLRHQQRSVEGLDDTERMAAISVDTGDPCTMQRMIQALTSLASP
jgi:aminoglycoside phosphotransferase family enzyme